MAEGLWSSKAASGGGYSWTPGRSVSLMSVSVCAVHGLVLFGRAGVIVERARAGLAGCVVGQYWGKKIEGRRGSNWGGQGGEDVGLKEWWGGGVVAETDETRHRERYDNCPGCMHEGCFAPEPLSPRGVTVAHGCGVYLPSIHP